MKTTAVASSARQRRPPPLRIANICTVYEIGEAEGRIYISMAYLEGQAVADLVADGAMEVDRVTTPFESRKLN